MPNQLTVEQYNALNALSPRLQSSGLNLGNVIDGLLTDNASGPSGITGEDLSADAATKIVTVRLGDLSATGSFMVPTPGFGCTLVRAKLLTPTAIAANDTDYWTFDLMNKGPAGTGTTAMLAATDANTTKATGGSAITSNVARSMTLHGTAANLDTAAGDGLIFTATKTASATTIANATLMLEFSEES